MTKEEQAVIRVAEAVVTVWAEQGLIDLEVKALTNVVKALHASRGPYPTAGGRWWAQNPNGRGDESLAVCREKDGVFIVDPGGRPVTEVVWCRDPLDPTKAQRNQNTGVELKQIAARLCVRISHNAEAASISRAKDLDQSTRSWASGRESAFLEVCDLLFRSFQLSDEHVRAAKEEEKKGADQ